MTSTTPATPASYATATQRENFPTKEQAITIDAVDGIPIKQYVNAIGNLVGPANIRFISRISNNRVCMYLSSPENVVNLIERHPTITVDGKILEIRPLISKAKRIILSNVCPVISHSVLENEFKKLNIKLESQMTFLRAGLADAGYTHIMNFRRQVYINPKDTDKIPESMCIVFEETRYWIYISNDTLLCFLCKKQGHLAKHCPEHATTEVERISTQTDNTRNQVETHSEQNLTLTQITQNNNHSQNPKEIPLPESTGQKRALSTTMSESSQENTQNKTLIPRTDDKHNTDTSDQEWTTQPTKSNRNKKKKIKVEPAKESDLETQLVPLKEILSSEENPYALDYLQVKSFLEKTKGHPNVKEVALEFNQDTSVIISCLKDIYPFLTERAIKSRITRIMNKLTNSNSKKNHNGTTTSGEEE